MLLKNFFRDAGKTAVKKVLKNYQKNIFTSVPSKKFKLSYPPSYNYSETESATYISTVCFENFKIGWRASVVESYLSKVTETFGFCRETGEQNSKLEYRLTVNS